jgi:hypothetical protein
MFYLGNTLNHLDVVRTTGAGTPQIRPITLSRFLSVARIPKLKHGANLAEVPPGLSTGLAVASAVLSAGETSARLASLWAFSLLNAELGDSHARRV